MTEREEAPRATIPDMVTWTISRRRGATIDRVREIGFVALAESAVVGSRRELAPLQSDFFVTIRSQDYQC